MNNMEGTMNRASHEPYPCDECGYEGPHSYLGSDGDDGPDTYECGDSSCYAEFQIPRDALRIS